MLDCDVATSHLLHSVLTASDHGSPDRNMVAAENLSAAGVTPDEMEHVHARHREVVAEARRRVAAKVAEIDKDNKGTPKTRLPWSNDHA